ncbi:MAG: D-glycerate dehydrogenase [Nitrospirae bacterium]|nr:MAG: D-glycerate dehydrogenase [Nitrospirota bacterium]
MKPKVLLTAVVPDPVLAKIEEVATVEMWENETPIPRQELLERVQDVEGVYCFLTDRIDREVVNRAPRLRVVSTMAVGYDHIDVEECTSRGIVVGHTPGVLTETTADLAFALLLATARRVVEAANFVKAGQWQRWEASLFLGQDVHGATLGIVGFGRIGQAVARRAQGFDMRILVSHSTTLPAEVQRAAAIRQVDFETLLEEADVVSLHVPLTPSTRHLLSSPEFRRMKPTAILINTARGPVVDTHALYDALHEKQIAAAGLDVTDPEPLPPQHPLLTLPNCVIVPHIGSASLATRRRMAMMAADNLVAGLLGQCPPHCVNPEAMTVREKITRHMSS